MVFNLKRKRKKKKEKRKKKKKIHHHHQINHQMNHHINHQYQQQLHHLKFHQTIQPIHQQQKMIIIKIKKIINNNVEQKSIHQHHYDE